MPQSVMSMVKPRGLVEVVIDEQGRVVAHDDAQSLHPAYDALILTRGARLEVPAGPLRRPAGAFPTPDLGRCETVVGGSAVGGPLAAQIADLPDLRPDRSLPTTDCRPADHWCSYRAAV